LLEAYTSRVVKLGWLKRTLALLATAVTVAGCSGINTQQTINPLMFFLPGLGQNKPADKQQQQPAATKTPTFDVVETASLTHTGDKMDSVQLN
jgi:hypothetical protein